MGTPSNRSEDPSPWEQTIADLESVAEERREAGFETVTIQAADTAPEPPAAGRTDRFGLVYTVPSNAADEFGAVDERAEFDEFRVYRRRVGETLYLVTELRDPGTETAVLIAGAVDLTLADALKRAARERGVIYTHLRLLDGTELGSFSHEPPEAFFGDLG